MSGPPIGLVERVYAAETLLAEFPEIGESRPQLGAHVRKWTVGNYVVFYRVEADAIVIIRILHGARDLGRLFES
jgi:toxin ParE1/3/4